MRRGEKGSVKCTQRPRGVEDGKLEAVKKTEALHKLWVEAKRGEDRARSKQEQLRLWE